MPSTPQQPWPARSAIAVLVASAALVGGASASERAVVPPRLASGQDTRVAYPERNARASARVVLQLHIDPEGKVRSSRPVEVDLEPHEADPTPFIHHAEARAQTLRFEPALQDGRPVAALIRLAFQLQPEDGAGSAPSTGPEAPPPAAATEPAAAPPAAEVTEAEPSRFSARAELTSGAAPAAANAASDLEIELGALRAVPRRAAQQYLTLAPGVVVVNHSGIGHAGGVFMRGFDAGEGQDLELRVDGVPINEPSNAHSHGYADTHFLIPEVVDRIRVLEGPFDPRQSDFAVAGSASYELAVRERGLRAQLGYGRFDERRALLLWAPRSASDGTFAAAEFRDGDGFGPNRAHTSTSALARYEDGTSSLRYAILLGSHALDFDSAGVLREDAVRARALPCARDPDSQFFCVADPRQGGSAARHLVNTQLEWRRPERSASLQAYGMLRDLRLRENFTGALLDERGDGLDENYEAASFGARGSYALTPKLWERRQRLELGFEARHDRGDTSALRVRRASGIPYAKLFDSDLALTHVGAYVRGELSPHAAFSVRGGARLDTFAFHTVDRATPARDRVGPRLPLLMRDAFANTFSPRGSVVAHLTPELDWTLSAGLGVRSSDAQALSEGEAAPFARVLALETGATVRTAIAPVHLEGRAFAFATRVADDLLFDPERGRNIPIGPSNRYGASASARARVGAQHDTLASLTWSEAHRIARDDGIFRLGGGPRLPFVPRWVARLDHASNAEFALGTERLRLGAALGFAWVGPHPLPLGTESRARFQVDVALRARLSFLELGVSIENLLDRRNHAAELHYASHFGAPEEPGSMRNVRHFAADTPRLWMFTLTAYFDDTAPARGDES